MYSIERLNPSSAKARNFTNAVSGEGLSWAIQKSNEEQKAYFPSNCEPRVWFYAQAPTDKEINSAEVVVGLKKDWLIQKLRARKLLETGSGCSGLSSKTWPSECYWKKSPKPRYLEGIVHSKTIFGPPNLKPTDGTDFQIFLENLSSRDFWILCWLYE